MSRIIGWVPPRSVPPAPELPAPPAEGDAADKATQPPAAAQTPGGCPAKKKKA